VSKLKLYLDKHARVKTLLKYNLTEKIKPVLFVNKIDRAILELKHDGETMY
jgi:elongation factor 2